MPEEELKKLYDSLGLAMTFKDFLHIQKYYNSEEKRDPSMTEIQCSGYILVRPLPSYNIFYRIKRC